MVFIALTYFTLELYMNSTLNVQPFEQLRNTDVESVGGKNASLGEMISQLATAGVRVPRALPRPRRRFAIFCITTI